MNGEERRVGDEERDDEVATIQPDQTEADSTRECKRRLFPNVALV